MARILMCSSDWYLAPPPKRGETPPYGGGLYYRMVLPGMALQAAGHQVFICPDMTQNPTTGRLNGLDWEIDELTGRRREHRDIDIITTMRWMRQEAPEIVQRARRGGQIVIADVDDFYWGLGTDNAAFWGTHPKANPGVNRDHYLRSIAASSYVISSTDFLAEFLSRSNKNTVVQRNMANLEIWRPRDTTVAGDRPRIGWTGSTGWRKKDLGVLKGILGPFMKQHDLEFAHVGAREDDPAAPLLGLDPETKISTSAQCPFAQFPRAVSAAKIDIGIVPMIDNSFNECKSALKGMEYTLVGAPFIATATSEYRWLDAGLLATRPHEWLSHLNRLLDPAERTLVNDTAYRRVRELDWRVVGKDIVTWYESIVR